MMESYMGVDRQKVSVSIPRQDAEFLKEYCPTQGKERARWIADLISDKVREIKSQQQATATQ